MTRILRFISDHAYGLTGVLFVLSHYILGARIDMPSETDSLQRTADHSNSLAAEYAAQHASVANKE